jgi:hypothetical protein
MRLSLASLALALCLAGCASGPPSPSLAWPAEADTLTGPEAAFSWNAVEAATLYRIEIASDSFFTSPTIANDSIPDTFFVVNLAFGGPLEGQCTYYWHAAAFNQNWSAWSNARSFYNANVNLPCK